jgi:ketosteroid isomerase-like protein
MNAQIDSKTASTTQAVIDRHLRAFAAGDLDAILSDDTEASVLITVNGPLVGLGPIRQLMTGLFAEFAKPGASFDMHTTHVAAYVGVIVWSARTADNVYELGTDTFVVREGKIAFQSFVGKTVPRSAANEGG